MRIILNSRTKTIQEIPTKTETDPDKNNADAMSMYILGLAQKITELCSNEGQEMKMLQTVDLQIRAAVKMIKDANKTS